MSGWETLNCHFHPDRVALERCEVCRKPLCAYCLYYTEDGQRLCAEHADLARKAGIVVEDPESYSNQLVGAQADIFRKVKRGQALGDRTLYKGNSTDLMALIGVVVALVSLASCGGMMTCIPLGPLVGLFLSIAALINSRKAFDSKRTRNLGLIGLVVSSLWLVLVVAVFFLMQIATVRLFNFSGNWANTAVFTPWPTDTPSPTPTPTVTAEDDPAAQLYDFRTPEPP